MKGDAKVIDYLNAGLRSELTAVSQYWLHYRLQEDWGFGHLADKSRAESIAAVGGVIFPTGVDHSTNWASRLGIPSFTVGISVLLFLGLILCVYGPRFLSEFSVSDFFLYTRIYGTGFGSVAAYFTTDLSHIFMNFLAVLIPLSVISYILLFRKTKADLIYLFVIVKIIT